MTLELEILLQKLTNFLTLLKKIIKKIPIRMKMNIFLTQPSFKLETITFPKSTISKLNYHLKKFH
jgi:hypothetical protein